MQEQGKEGKDKSDVRIKTAEVIQVKMRGRDRER